jgi:hypothetical protein
MKKILLMSMAAFMLSCNDGADNTADSNAANDTSLRPRPVTEGVTNSTKIVGDSVIVPDTNNTGINPSAGVDTMGPMRKKNNNNQ